MTGTQILARAEAYTDEAIDEADALIAINEAIDKLSDMGLIYDSVNITAGSANAWYPLPADYTSLVSVIDGIGRDYMRYQQRGMEIRFADAGTYTVNYRRHPDGIESLEDTPALHVSYHDVLCTYLKAWAKLKEDDESTDGMRLMAQFERDAAKVFGILRRRRGVNIMQVERAAIPG